MEMEVPSFHTLEANNGFDLSAMASARGLASGSPGRVWTSDGQNGAPCQRPWGLWLLGVLDFETFAWINHESSQPSLCEPQTRNSI